MKAVRNDDELTQKILFKYTILLLNCCSISAQTLVRITVAPAVYYAKT